METNTGKNNDHGFLINMFSESGQGGRHISTMRVLITFIVLVIMLNWSYLCIATTTMIEFSWQEMVVIISPLFAKAVQKKYEK